MDRLKWTTPNTVFFPQEREGYLAHKKQRPPRTLQQQYAYGPMATLGGGAVVCERGTPVEIVHPNDLKKNSSAQEGAKHAVF